ARRARPRGSPARCARGYWCSAAGSSAARAPAGFLPRDRETWPRLLLIQRFDGPLGQRGSDGRFLDAQLDVVGHLHLDEVVFYLVDDADEPAGRDHLVALRQAGHQRLMLLAAFALRPPQQEIEDQDESA